MRTRAGTGCLLVGVLLAMSGCSWTQSEFAREAGEAGAGFAAAATTLTYVHQAKVSRAYARSSFVNYCANLSGFDRRLPALGGAPDAAEGRLVSLVRAAEAAVATPCLDDGCDWSAQIDALNQAGAALHQASGG